MFDLLFSTTGIHTVPAPLDALTEELATLQASLNAGGDEHQRGGSPSRRSHL